MICFWKLRYASFLTMLPAINNPAKTAQNDSPNDPAGGI